MRSLEQPCVCAQLETVYVLEGLGPPKDEAAAGRTFADQVLTLLFQLSAFPVYSDTSGTNAWLGENRLPCIGVLHLVTWGAVYGMHAAMSMHEACTFGIGSL